MKRALFAAAVAGQIRRESPESNTFTPDSNEPISDVMIMAAGNNLNYGGTTTDARGNLVLRIPESVQIDNYRVTVERGKASINATVITESPLVLQLPADL